MSWCVVKSILYYCFRCDVVDVVELRQASINLLLSMIGLPLHFLNQPLPGIYVPRCVYLIMGKGSKTLPIHPRSGQYTALWFCWVSNCKAVYVLLHQGQACPLDVLCHRVWEWLEQRPASAPHPDGVCQWHRYERKLALHSWLPTSAVKPSHRCATMSFIQNNNVYDLSACLCVHILCTL